MCLIVLGIKSHPVYKLVFAANRDEYYDRPSAPLDFWKEAPNLLAGKDLRAGGTWFGITRSGRIAAITNFRDPASHKDEAPSRGELITRFLLGDDEPTDYLEALRTDKDRYNGYNLILGTKDNLYWYSNRGNRVKRLLPGLHGLSNHLLDTPWPKVVRTKEAMGRLLAREDQPHPDEIFHFLSDCHVVDEESLPNTGVGLELEQKLSSVFITIPDYGTRSSTILLIDRDDHVTCLERTFHPNHGAAETVKHSFTIES
ncbi:MAG: NRDE family protein [Desulfatiglans sp.]|jgi:uncharacterized protein with NRDE domain|nr:NRDE family protein [Thermodesulfobacteriota bacterium]MEE4353569.1 NRDE family protein [Desulfatiglans sp.]